ncbi:MAG: hypothetical protein DMG07_25240, partial [Acidobacteria bacterium]
MAAIEKALTLSPADPTLTQLQAALLKAFQESRQRDRNRLRRLAEEAETATDAAPKQISVRAAAVAQAVTSDIKKRLDTESIRHYALGRFDRVGEALTAVGARSRDALELLASKAASLMRGLRDPAKETARSMRVWLPAGAALIGLVIGLGYLIQITRRPAGTPAPAAPPSLVTVEIDTSPSSATVRVNNEIKSSPLKVELPRGTYQLEAWKEGYQLLTKPVAVSAGSPSIRLDLEPLPASLRVLADVGEVWLDKQLKGEVQDGGFTLDGLVPGLHELRIAARRGEAGIHFETAAGSAPLLTGALDAQGLVVVVVGTLGATARVHTSMPGARVSLDGGPAEAAGPAGLELKGLSDGPHMLTLDDGKEIQSVDMKTTAAPTLSVRVLSPNLGTLLVATGEENFRVFLDDVEQHAKTQGGELRIRNLEARD